MKTEHKRKLVRLIEKENIRFHGPGDIQPGRHRQLVGAIQELSRYEFERYFHNFTYEVHQKPWRAKIKPRVERIVRLAEDCRQARQNELGWRLKLEPEILSRFTTEVTCKSCSSRLWRSEVEVLLNPSDEFGESLDLEQRQMNRSPCTCSEVQRDRDQNDSGISRIFHDRADEPVKYPEDDPIFGVLPTEQKPDRIYGFRNTSRFSRLLDEESLDPQHEGQELRDILECGPFNELRDQVLFPFLVLEAKCETGDSFDDVEIQTAFAIKKLLDIQFKLRSATGEKSQWQSGPLVWFFSNRGDSWRVALANTIERQGKLHCHVSQVWTGNIRSKDAALQLLLIIDYVFDWARDSQREAILNELRILAGRNTGSIADDSEVMSLGHRMQRYFDAGSDQRLMESRADDHSVGPRSDAVYQWLDSELCVFRSICWAHSRLSALYITKDNLKTLLSSFASNAVSQRHIRDLLRLFRDAWKVSSDALEALEFMWTGTQRENPDLYGATQTFCTVFTVAAYFRSDWEQVCELTYIAIAEDALDDLKALHDIPQQIHVYPSELPAVQPEHLIGFFRFLRQSSARSKFHAVTQRRCLSSRLAREADAPEAFFLRAEDHFDEGVRFRFDVTMLPERNPKARQIVAAVYNQCKRGMREPEESFLRMSTTYDSTPWDLQDIPSLWALEDPPVSEGTMYIVLESPTTINKMDARFCIYILDDLPGPQAFPINFDGLESRLTAERNSSRTVSDHRFEWNVRRDPDSIDSTLSSFRQLQQQFQNFMIQRAPQPTTGHGDEGVRRSSYHPTGELPPHMRTNSRTPQGHWVTNMPDSNRYEDVRATADAIVARRNNVKLITCLYTAQQIAGRAGLKSKTWRDTKVESKQQRKDLIEELKYMSRTGQLKPGEVKIANICQKGDRFNLPHPDSLHRRKRASSATGQSIEVGVGDWLTDSELNGSMREGFFKDDQTPSNRLRDVGLGSIPTTEEAERPPKRQRRVHFQEDVDGSGEGPSRRQRASRKPEESILGDHVTDEDLEGLLDAGYFAET